MSFVVWEAPPLPVRGSQGSTVPWARIQEELRTRPGHWARVRRTLRYSAAIQVATRVRGGQTRWGPRGTWGVAVRTAPDGDASVYLVYRGAPDEADK